MEKPLEGCDAKLGRATEHLNRLDAEVRAFLDAKPYSFVGEFKPKRSQYVFRVSISDEGRRQIAEIGATFGDLFHNLRSALDHLVFDLARINVSNPRKTNFPIYDEPPEGGFAHATRDSLRWVGMRERALIEELQPYNRIDREALALSLIRRFNNQDKHRSPVGLTGAIAENSVQVAFSEGRDVVFTGETKIRINRLLKDDAEIYELPTRATGDNPEMSMHGEPALEIAFGSREKLLRWEAVPPTAGEAFRVVSRFRPFFERLFKP